MSNKIIRSLLEARLATWAAARSPALRIVIQNHDLDPPLATGEVHLRAFLLPAPTSSDDLAGDMRNYLGVFQVSIVVPPGNGTALASTIESELDALFPANLRISTTPASNLTVQMITPMSAMGGIQEADGYVVPVRAQYRADVI